MTWLDQVFDAEQVRNGGIIRRSIDSINTYSSMAEILQEIKKRNFHAVEVGNQMVIFCRADVTIVC